MTKVAIRMITFEEKAFNDKNETLKLLLPKVL